MEAEATGAVANFCAALRLLVKSCHVQQGELARVLHRSEATVSNLLSGKRSTPPTLDDVLEIVGHCRRRVGAQQVLGLSLETAWWRTRHAELVMAAEGRGRSRGKQHARRARHREENVTFDFREAVEVLAGGRSGFDGLADQLLEPLRLGGGTVADLHGLLDGFGARVRASHGTTRTALLCAVDVVVLVTAFCDAVAASGVVYGPELVNRQGEITSEILQELSRITLGSCRVRDGNQVREEIASAYACAAEAVHRLSDPFGHPPHHLIEHAVRRYDTLLASISMDCPELHLISGGFRGEPEDDREESVGLAGLGLLLREFAGDPRVSAGQQERLRAPIVSAERTGFDIPALAAGYVNPAFRFAESQVGRPLSSDEWWDRQPLRNDIEDFLAAYLLTDEATRAPLLVFGHPGSGKSLLTKLIEARLPESEFFCIRVELRYIAAEVDVQEQLEQGLFRATGRRAEWPDAVDPASGVVRVVLLDGFDELLQAGADRPEIHQQRDYLKSIERFQQREARLGRPTVVVVTSRTVVADQAAAPSASTAIRLNPFDRKRIESWLKVWEVTNRRYFASRHLEPLTWDVVRSHRELASQPLLLLMLALYDAVGNPMRALDAEGIERVGLYEKLLVEFVRRQVVKHRGTLPVAEESVAVEEELRRLGVIAMGMFNRRGQSIMEREANRDLAALLGEEDSLLLFGRFFFVHEAQALVTGQELRAYEFLHATFGEYLVGRLIGGELQRVMIESVACNVCEVDDGRLYALLSFVPITDRAEVVRNLAELLSSFTSETRAQLKVLLRELFQGEHWVSSRRAGIRYEPISRSRVERDAVYDANLLLLAVLVDGGVKASEFFDTNSPVDRWWRCAQLWRSQFSEASWEALTKTLQLERIASGDGFAKRWDLWITMGDVPPVVHDLAWQLQMQLPGPSVYYDPEGLKAGDVIRRISFLCDTDVQQLLHGLSPLLVGLPETLRTHHIGEDQSVRSAIHALVSLLCRNAEQPEQLLRPYLEVLSILQRMPSESCLPVAEVLARHVVYDAARLPGDAVLRLLGELTNPRLGDLGGLSVQTCLALLACIQEQVGRSDLPQDRVAGLADEVVTHLTRATDKSVGPQDSLLCTIRTAMTTNIWYHAGYASGGEALDRGLGLLQRVPPAERTPEAVIGLLRLAREFGRDDWLVEHAEPLLLSLRIEGLGLLRPTDVDSLRHVVRDTALLAVLSRIEHVWRS